MNKQTYLFVIVLMSVVLVIGGCVPASQKPAAATTEVPTAVPASPEPVATSEAAVPVTATPAPATPDSRPTVPTPPADGSRPLAALQPAERVDRFSGPAPMSIDPNTIYIATIVTDKGNIVVELYQDTPQSTNNFVTLAQDGFYDGLTFHRVEPGFVVQGGDPAGDGSGGPGYTIPAEIKHNHLRGALAWARTGDQINPERRSSGSQFYITLDAAPFLDGAYTVFGYVVDGMDVVDQIAVGDTIKQVNISTAEASRLPTPTPTPAPKAPVMEEGRPLADLPVEQREKLYNTAPEMVIDTAKSYQATIKSDKGEIVIDLDPTKAPVAVNNFVLLSDLGFYDDMPVAYVQPDSYIVLGSPASRPDSDVGYVLQPEVPPGGSEVITGTVSMYPVMNQASQQILASGSQFFITLSPAPKDDTTPLSVFGIVTSGQDVVSSLGISDTITSITITEK